MPTQAVVLEATRDRVRVAYYYPVPVAQQLAAAIDPARVAASDRLEPAELTALREGHVVEHLADHDAAGLAPGGVRAMIEAAWLALRPTALKAYRAEYGGRALVGATWDGTTWRA